MASKGKRIGFVDYKLGNFHSDTYLSIYRGELKDRGYEVTACTALDATSAQEWSAKFDVPYMADMAELDAAVDHYIVLAPSDPELHLQLCEMVFPFGKPTYVDKTFAPDTKTAQRIFRLADKHGVPMQTTSALRYTNVQEKVAELGGPDAVQHMVAWGGGGSFGEYAIHPVELVISSMGSKAKRLHRRGKGKQSQLIIDFTGGRTAVVNVYVEASTPFAASVTTAGKTEIIPVDSSAIFVNMAAAILDLFDAGAPNIDRAESLMIRRILDAADDPAALNGFVKV